MTVRADPNLLRDVHTQQRAAFKREVLQERLAQISELSGRIAAGDRSVELFVQLARLHGELLDFRAAREVLEHGCPRDRIARGLPGTGSGSRGQQCNG